MRGHSNAGDTDAPTLQASLAEDMVAFDLLPKLVRDAINECAVEFGIVDILMALATHNVSPQQVADAVRRQGLAVCRKDWLKTFGYDYLTGAKDG